ncbi:MAG: glycosyltransferase family 2 protein [Chitinophagaceae bacterium]
MAFFSVIIPNFNHASFLRQRVDSVLNQTITDFEVILLDDHSSDNSQEIIEEYRSNKKITHIVFNEQNSESLLDQWSKGVGLASGEWIWIAESDDIADPYFLEECVNTMNKHPGAGLVYCDSKIMEETTGEITGSFSKRKNSIFKTEKWNKDYCQNGIIEINECLKYDCTVNNVSAAVFRKDLALQTLQQQLQFRYYADWYFFLQLCLVTDICYTSKTLNTYRFHPSSLLNAETSLATSKKEYFKILKLLYRNSQITSKKELLDHYAFNYLSFGIIKDGPAKIFSIARSYFASDKNLALKILQRICLIKLFYQRYKAKFEIKGT